MHVHVLCDGSATVTLIYELHDLLVNTNAINSALKCLLHLEVSKYLVFCTLYRTWTTHATYQCHFTYIVLPIFTHQCDWRLPATISATAKWLSPLVPPLTAQCCWMLAVPKIAFWCAGMNSWPRGWFSDVSNCPVLCLLFSVKMVVQRRNVYISGINRFQTDFIYYVHFAVFVRKISYDIH